MATAWRINGNYYETCSCDLICPCILGQMAARPSQGWCTFAMAFKIERGRYGDESLDGLGFVVVGRTPEEMAKGNWSVGVIADERASASQRDAITAIVSGQAGGPMSAVSALVGNFLGVESAPIVFDRQGVKWAVKAGSFINMGAEALMGINPAATEPMHLQNTGHPANDRLAVCRATNSHVEALGLKWNDSSGKNNGHYAPFSWSNA